MIEVRSYRRVFDLERRIYSIDRLRLNPGGVPVRGVGYFTALLLAALIAGVAPPLAPLVRAIPWFVRDLLVPGVGALLLGVVRVDGRTFHVAAVAVIRHLLAPRVLDGLLAGVARQTRWSPQEIVVLPDGSDARLRRLRYVGPGAVLVSVEHELSGGTSRSSRARRGRRASGRAVVLREGGRGARLEDGQVVVLEQRARLLVLPRPRRGSAR